MSRKLISTGSPFEKGAGFSRAVVETTNEGTWCFVSGTTGYDYEAMSIPESVADQARNTIRTIANALAEAGLTLSDVVRARYVIAKAEYRGDVFTVLGEAFGEIRPSATMIVAGLIEPEMKIEIDVTAFRPH
jgi:enamine deaminase RidA (YjgF/YER057c/UK114 family)